MIIDVSDIAALKEFSIKLANNLPSKCIITLEGNLGVGKTAFSQFFLKALGVKSHVISPSYMIVNEYYTDQYIVHADFYRLNCEDNLDLLGWDIMLEKADIIVVEWPKSLVKADIQIKMVLGEKRTLELITDYKLNL